MKAAAILLSSLLGVFGLLAAAEPTPGATSRAQVRRRYGLDPQSTLESRVGPTPASVLEMFQEPGTALPMHHELTEPERKQLAAAFAALPPRHRRVLAQRLRSLSFLDGMPNTALTSLANPGDEYRLFDITMLAGIFKQDMSEWLTEKERTCFDATGSPLEVDVDVGALPAIVYALLHEATHVVDASLHVTPAPTAAGKPGDANASGFTRGVWVDNLTPAPPYRDPLLESLLFRNGGKVLPIDKARAVYEALARTPFASLYGSRNWSDDLAEYVALYEVTRTLGQPYRIEVRKGAEKIFVYEPMKSDLVLSPRRRAVMDEMRSATKG